MYRLTDIQLFHLLSSLPRTLSLAPYFFFSIFSNFTSSKKPSHCGLSLSGDRTLWGPHSQPSHCGLSLSGDRSISLTGL